jgi:hypothetical protein
MAEKLLIKFPRVGLPSSIEAMLEREKMIADMPGTCRGCSANTLVAYIQDPEKVRYISPTAADDHLAYLMPYSWNRMIIRVRTMLDENENPALTLTNELRARNGKRQII